ncbi:hypothetical protein FA13DRAFT_1737620, partial [Coprinellus micaceus]
VLKRKLVLAFDVGTTFSGVSYCILDPGSTPRDKGCHEVPRLLSRLGAASKIPTVQAIAEKRWVKGRSGSNYMSGLGKESSSSEITSKIPPLPLDKSVTRGPRRLHLLICSIVPSRISALLTRTGLNLWRSSSRNGWEGYQQTQLRQAVVKAGFDREMKQGGERVLSSAEGEASLWFALAAWKGEGVVIIDAGGGTIDISTYQKPSVGKKVRRDLHSSVTSTAPIFVTVAARKLLEDSVYHDDIDHIVNCFDKTTKIRFSDDTLGHYVKFGSTKDRDDEVGIRFGQLKLSGRDVAMFFEPSVQCIVETPHSGGLSTFAKQRVKWIAGGVEKVLKPGARNNTHVVLVGGFGSSDWLLKQLKKELEPLGLTVIKPDLYVNKAVSDGAIAFHLSSQVQARIAKYDYGVIQRVRTSTFQHF